MIDCGVTHDCLIPEPYQWLILIIIMMAFTYRCLRSTHFVPDDTKGKCVSIVSEDIRPENE